MTKTVLITGTSSGLGRATAKLFQSRGWNVVATMRDPSKEIEFGTLERTLVTRLDVEDAKSIQEAVESGIRHFGGIDVLVNNAGFGAFGPLEVTPMEAIRRQFEVNVFGVLQTMQAVLPHFRSKKSGTIVNVTSTGGRMTFPLGSLYHGSKFAVEGVSEALQYELAPLGIKIKLVEPGAIETDFSGRSLLLSNDTNVAEYQPILQAVLEAYGQLMSSGSKPEKIAEIIYTAARDGAATLRYAAGDDAVQMLAARTASSDDEFFAGIAQQFGIAS